MISTGESRFETAWKNKKICWSELLKKLSQSAKTPESHAEYMKLPKAQQDRIKDIGGFVGGHLAEGRRKNDSVTARQILTLDLDFPPADFWNVLMDNLDIDSALAVYSTHKHSPGSARYRLVMPLDRTVTSDEYEAIARKYFYIGCAIMTPNDNRIELLGRMVDEFQADGVVEMILSGCHSVHMESISVRNFVSEEKHIPYIDVVTDYSPGDVGQLNTRMAAFIEMLGSR